MRHCICRRGIMLFPVALLPNKTRRSCTSPFLRNRAHALFLNRQLLHFWRSNKWQGIKILTTLFLGSSFLGIKANYVWIILHTRPQELVGKRPVFRGDQQGRSTRWRWRWRGWCWWWRQGCVAWIARKWRERSCGRSWRKRLSWWMYYFRNGILWNDKLVMDMVTTIFLLQFLLWFAFANARTHFLDLWGFPLRGRNGDWEKIESGENCWKVS